MRLRAAAGIPLLLAVAAEARGQDSPDRLRTGAMFTLANAVPLAWNRFVHDYPWARIGPASWGRNLRDWFTWDDDRFFVNQLAHPYHGALYFSAGRANGVGFYGSAPLAITGSFLWEFFAEAKQPTLNDWVSTSAGGIALGEATWRIARLLLDAPTRGLDRRWRELMALGLSPPAGLNALLGDDRRGADPSPPWRLTAEPGIRATLDRASRGTAQARLVRVTFEYGDPHAPETRGAFDAFTLLSEAATGARVLPSRLEVRGLLSATRPARVPGGSVRLGTFLGLDYHDHEALQAGGQSLEIGLLYGNPDPGDAPEKPAPFRMHLGLAAVLLGAVPTTPPPADGSRSFDYGPGAGLRAGAQLGGRGGPPWLEAAAYRWRMWAVDGPPPDARHDVLAAELTLRLPIGWGWGVGGGLEIYEMASREGGPPIRRSATRARVFLVWGFRQPSSGSGDRPQ